MDTLCLSWSDVCPRGFEIARNLFCPVCSGFSRRMAGLSVKQNLPEQIETPQNRFSMREYREEKEK